MTFNFFGIKWVIVGFTDADDRAFCIGPDKAFVSSVSKTLALS